MHKIAAIVEGLGHQPVPWDAPTTFVPGTYTLSGLIDLTRDVDAAIFIFAEDDRVWYRSSELHQARDNVLFEYGLFVGILGQDRALICRKGQPKTPSDLEGIVHIDIAGIEAARARIEHWIKRLDKHSGAASHTLLAREFVRVVANDRKVLDREYRDRKYSAHEIDVVSIALTNALDELATDRQDTLLRRIILENVHVRLLFVAPNSDYVQHRAREDGDSVDQLRAHLRRSVRRSVDVYERLRVVHEQAAAEGRLQAVSVGSLEIRVTEHCPYMTVFRTDNTVLLGLYTAAAKGLDTAVLQVHKAHDALFHQVTGHFNRLWSLRGDNEASDAFLVKCHSLMPPALNRALIDRLLDEGAAG
jgi:hypothetical protein